MGLVETTRTHAAPERGSLEAIVQARRLAIEAEGVAPRAEAENVLSSALTVLFAQSESYPELRANQRFVELRRELGATEERLASTSRRFNQVGAAFNVALRRPPGSILASGFGFKALEAFDLRPTTGE